MKQILLSIHPEYVDKILSGEKTFEFRTRIPKEEISSMLIYETSPIKKIVAQAEVIRIWSLPPEKLWDIYKKQAGISKGDYAEYFKGRDIAHAYQLGKIEVFPTPMDLKVFDIQYPPQNYVYIND